MCGATSPNSGVLLGVLGLLLKYAGLCVCVCVQVTFDLSESVRWSRQTVGFSPPSLQSAEREKKHSDHTRFWPELHY